MCCYAGSSQSAYLLTAGVAIPLCWSGALLLQRGIEIVLHLPALSVPPPCPAKAKTPANNALKWASGILTLGRLQGRRQLCALSALHVITPRDDVRFCRAIPESLPPHRGCRYPSMLVRRNHASKKFIQYICICLLSPPPPSRLVQTMRERGWMRYTAAEEGELSKENTAVVPEDIDRSRVRFQQAGC